MISFIKKDLILSIKTAIFGSIYGLSMVFIMYKTNNDILAKVLFVSIIIFSSVVTFNYLVVVDGKHNADITFISLPIKRSNAVKSRYLVVGTYPFVFSIIQYLFMIFLKVIRSDNFLTLPNNININIVNFAISITLIYLAFCLPFYYFSIGKAKILSQVITLFAILTPGLISKFSDEIISSPIIKFISVLNFRTISLISLGISLIIYIISLQLSISIYNKKEF